VTIGRRKAAQPEPDEEDEGITERPAKVKAKAGKTSGRARDRDDEDFDREDRPKKRSKKAGMSGLVIGAIIGGGVFLLVAILGVIGIVIYLKRSSEVVVAKVDQKALVQPAVPGPGPVVPAQPPPPVPAQPKKEPAPAEPPRVATGNPEDVPPGWKFYRPIDRAFSAWIPERGKFYELQKNVFVKPGGIMQLKLARLEQQEGLTFDFGVLILPLQMRKASPDEILELFRNMHVKEAKGTLVSETNIKQGKAIGKDYFIQSDNGLLRLRMFAATGEVFSSGALYRAEVSGSKSQVESTDAQMFLDAFKLQSRDTGIQSATPKQKNPDAPKK
jgi:hypothetical protein